MLFQLAHCKTRQIERDRLRRTRPNVGHRAGQMSRVDASRIAVWKAQEAGLSLEGSAWRVTLFFPFADGLIAPPKLALPPRFSPADRSATTRPLPRGRTQHGDDLHRRASFPALSVVNLVAGRARRWRNKNSNETSLLYESKTFRACSVRQCLLIAPYLREHRFFSRR